MKHWKTWKIILFTALCVCLNVGGKLLAVRWELPLWADSFGTVLCAYVAGPVCGAIVGLTGNLAYSVLNRLSAFYSITGIAIGIIIGIAAKHKWFERFYGFMKAASFAMLTALVVSVPVDILLDGGYTGNKWGNGVVDYLLDGGWPAVICTVMGQLAIEFADKVLTVAAVYLVILMQRWNRRRSEENNVQRGSAGKAALILLLSFSLGMSAFSTAVAGNDAHTAASGSETPDYNDYVQTVYSSNNGLPCGEANDIAQTNDIFLSALLTSA